MGNAIHMNCSHDTLATSSSKDSSSPPKHIITSYITSVSYHRVVYHNNNTTSDGRRYSRFVSRTEQPNPNAYRCSKPLNPLCVFCRKDIFALLLNSEYLRKEAHDELKRFSHEVRTKVKSMRSDINKNNKHVKDKDKDKDNAAIVIYHQIHKHGLPDRVIDQEEYMRLLAKGVVFDEEVVPIARPASELAIRGLQRVVLSNDKLVSNDEDNNMCSICLQELVIMKKEENYNDKDDNEELINKSSVVRLPCKHMFHEGCVVKWLRRSHVCPNCRFKLPLAS